MIKRLVVHAIFSDLYQNLDALLINLKPHVLWKVENNTTTTAFRNLFLVTTYDKQPPKFTFYILRNNI